MKKSLSLLVLFAVISSTIQPLFAQNISSGLVPVSEVSVDILQDGITSANAGTIMFEKTFTDGNLSLANLKFSVVKGAKVSLDANIKKSFEISNKTRANYAQAKKASTAFKAKVTYFDKIIEYPDRVRIISQTEYSYENKAEHDLIFAGTKSQAPTISAKQVQKFLAMHPEYAAYADGLQKVNKTQIIEKLSAKILTQCQSGRTSSFASCNAKTIKAEVTKELNAYRGKRVVTEQIDVNKIPLIYDADKSINFEQRLKDSNISQEPGNVRIDKLQIARALAQYTGLSLSQSGLPALQTQAQTAKEKNCDGLTGVNLNVCTAELAKLQANNNGTSLPSVQSGTLLNGFTLGQSYSYYAGDSCSVLGFEVYNVGMSFYAGYGVGIRIPIDVTMSVDKTRLEKGVSQNYRVDMSVDTADKDATWFKNALGSSKAFDGKEAVLEAGAYAKWHIYLFESKIFAGQIGGKKDWGGNYKIPFGTDESLKIFDGVVYGEDIGLEIMLYGIHLVGDLKVSGYVSGDISYECRTLASKGVSWSALKCADITNTALQDKDVADIEISPENKTTQLLLKADSNEFYYQNALGVYQKYGVSVNRFKYKPNLTLDISLRAKVGIDTGDYFGWVWIAKTDWLKVYSFELDMPTLKSHEWYSPVAFANYQNNYLYNFNQTTQDIPDGDFSTTYPSYSLATTTSFLDSSIDTKQSNTDQVAEGARYNYNQAGNAFLQPSGRIIFGDTHAAWYQNFYTVKSVQAQTGGLSPFNYNQYGYIRKTPGTQARELFQDYAQNKVAELQYADENTAYYYSQATNALWKGSVAGVGQLALSPYPQLKNDTRYMTLKTQGKKPKKNEYVDYRIDDQYLSYTAPTYLFNKFTFAFAPNFASNKTFAYVSENGNIQVANGNTWKEIALQDDGIEGTPVHLAFSLSADGIHSDLAVVSYNATTKTYFINVYRYQNDMNPLVYEFSPAQKSFVFEAPVLSLDYDMARKTVYVASITNPDKNYRYSGKITAIRFNGTNHDVDQQDIFTFSQNREELLQKYTTQNEPSLLLGKIQSQVKEGEQSAAFIYNLSVLPNGKLLASTVSYFPSELGSSWLWVREFTQLDYTIVNKNSPPAATQNMLPPPTQQNPENEEATTDDLFSQNAYVNEKLDEINTCFLDNYEAHLQNIDTTLKNLQDEKDKQTSDVEKAKYQKAIETLQEIRVLFLKRYQSILKLKK